MPSFYLWKQRRKVCPRQSAGALSGGKNQHWGSEQGMGESAELWESSLKGNRAGPEMCVMVISEASPRLSWLLRMESLAVVLHSEWSSIVRRIKE